MQAYAPCAPPSQRLASALKSQVPSHSLWCTGGHSFLVSGRGPRDARAHVASRTCGREFTARSPAVTCTSRASLPSAAVMRPQLVAGPQNRVHQYPLQHSRSIPLRSRCAREARASMIPPVESAVQLQFCSELKGRARVARMGHPPVRHDR